MVYFIIPFLSLNPKLLSYFIPNSFSTVCSTTINSSINNNVKVSAYNQLINVLMILFVVMNTIDYLDHIIIILLGCGGALTEDHCLLSPLDTVAMTYSHLHTVVTHSFMHIF